MKMTLEQLEELRKKAKNKAILCGVLPPVAGILAAIITHRMLMLYAGLIVMILGVIYASKSISEYSKQFKEQFVLTSLKEVFDDLVYKPTEGLPRSVIADTEMMRMGDHYSSNDYVSGTYKGIHVTQADVHIEEEYETTDSDGDTTTHYETLFKGRWMVFDFNKEFKANVQVAQKGFKNAKRKRFFVKKEEKYKLVSMEDEAFNKGFKVYAQDEHDAFYILTPTMMERIKKVSQGIDGKVIFCFVRNMLHVGVHNKKDSFEPKIFKKIDPEKVRAEVTSDIDLITGFVDELSLDTKLFKA